MKPTLLVLAAGMGSRYGGLKQMDGLGPHGETIIDYSIHDAVEAGFGKIVYIVRDFFKEDMKKHVAEKYAGVTANDGSPLEFVFVSQELDVIYKGARTVVAAPDGRFAVNLSGCPALATAGTGDLLAGMTGAMLLDPGLSTYDAARTAVFLHGFTAEITAQPGYSRGFIADDFLPMIGNAMHRI